MRILRHRRTVRLRRSARQKSRCPALCPSFEFEHAFCFGAGSGYAAALEGALKMKEMPLLHAEGSETWEMASGPSTMVDERALCVALYTGSEGDEPTAAGARHARDWGARVIDIGPDAPANDMHLPVAVPQSEPFASLALVAPLYLLAIESLVRGASILKSLIGASGTTHRV